MDIAIQTIMQKHYFMAGFATGFVIATCLVLLIILLKKAFYQ